MTTSISLRCPTCDARIKAPSELRGQWRQCPRCNQRLYVRVQPPQDAGPLLVAEEQQGGQFSGSANQ